MADRKDSELDIKSTLVDGDLIPVLDSETAEEEEKNKTVSASTFKSFTANAQRIIFDLSDWNMDIVTIKTISLSTLGITDKTKVVSWDIIIRNDAGTDFHKLEGGNPTINNMHVQGYATITGTDFEMRRLDSGLFDNSSYSGTGDRGKIYFQIQI